MSFRSLTFVVVILLAGQPTRWLFAQSDQRTRETDQALVRALQFLASEQQPSGAWRTNNRDAASATSLAVMSFLAVGHTPGDGPYGARIENGIRWVLDHQDESGLFRHRAGSGPMYTHGICTLMLAEVCGMVRGELAPRVRHGLEQGIRVILTAQAVSKGPRHAGGWRYQPQSRDSDLSVTGWQLLALRAAKDIGCDVPAEAIDSAVGYVRLCADQRGGFGYQPGHGVTSTRAGTGILCLEICGEHHADETLRAADYLLRKPLNRNENFFYYGVYYCTVGMFQVGDRHWEATRTHMTSLLLPMQEVDGSWPNLGREKVYGPIYSTAMTVLALSVEYRYLPIYQR
ncbi:MAG: prenyltransferase/squalene oxidase repeat-containing protein [Planctomycetota bacterium]